MDPPSALASPSLVKLVDTYKKAAATAASVTAYAVLARGMARELLPDDLCALVSWGASLLRARMEPPPVERCTVVVSRIDVDSSNCDDYNAFYTDVHDYLATRIDPRSMRRLRLSGGGASKVMSMDRGDSMTDLFEGVQFRWASVPGDGDHGVDSLELSFDAEHMDMALGRYVPSITAAAEQARRLNCALRIYMNESTSWRGISHHHPATFDTLAMDPPTKQAVIADIDRFLKRKEYYRRIGKAWKRGYLLYGPPGTGKSSLVAAVANYLRFNLYDLDLAELRCNSMLQRLLIGMPNKSILVIEDIDCCFTATSREDGKDRKTPELPEDGSDDCSSTQQNITLSGLLNFIDGLWSTSGEERIIIFTTNYKDRLDPALLRPGRMDMHVYMGYCGWEAFKTLARNYFLVDDHPLFQEIQGLLAQVEVTPAEVSEMLLRNEDVDVAMQGLVEFLLAKMQGKEDAGKA
ncbi:AAA-ATPase At3g50940 isoform X1 [Lolium perenne]|uniref:AAA-ATPase At3g50940 isoform X1 n=1 Tax=Lolium perenne TaxID=4522 RepID=UPI0021E9E9CB|nr:AAA-ATPase At3g50940-like isoform X1 [Lolium perenne]